MSEVILKNVFKSYEKNQIIKDVSLEIKDKEFLVLVGASGCGKSTLLRMIAGLETITDGEIFIDGKCVNNIPPKDRDIAFVFQNYALYPHMSVYENMAFPLKMRGTKKTEIDVKVKEAAKILNLEDLLDRKPKQLSGGQRQRVALGRAIVRKPKVFLMDEPLSNLDAKLRVQMRSEIKKLHQKLETTFIYVTHDQTEALTMGDRIAVIEKGVIQQVSDADTIYSTPQNVFVAGFLGLPPMNFTKFDVVENELISNDIKIYLSEDQKQKIGNLKKVIIGIRPESFSLEPKNIKLTVTPDLVEMLGSEKILYFYANETKFNAILPSTAQIKGDTDIYFNSKDIHIFNAETKNRI